MMIGVPLALGSWWGLAVLVLLLPVLAWRILDEEKFLAQDLPGYSEYEQKVRYRLVPYLDEEMPLAIRAADLVLCRSGASTLSELAVLGKPGLLVPLPPAIGGSPQEANAAMFERTGAGLVIKDADLEPKLLAERVKYIMTSAIRRTEMVGAVRGLARPEATQDIVAELIKIARVQVTT